MRLSSYPRALFRFFTWSLAWDLPVCSWQPPSWKLIFFIPIFADEKGCYFCFRILANHLASFFFLHPVRRFVQTTISIQYIPFFIHPVTECKHLLAFILTQICYFGSEELTYILYFLQQASQSWPTFLILLLTVSPWQPVNSNMGGRGNSLFLSSQW